MLAELVHDKKVRPVSRHDCRDSRHRRLQPLWIKPTAPGVAAQILRDAKDRPVGQNAHIHIAARITGALRVGLHRSGKPQPARQKLCHRHLHHKVGAAASG